jgi:hypothetical protein
LSIARAIATAHRAAIIAAGRAGGGLELSVELPVHGEVPASP